MYVISIKHKQGHVDYKIYSKKEAKKRAEGKATDLFKGPKY